jgi:hypothetical protein
MRRSAGGLNSRSAQRIQLRHTATLHGRQARRQDADRRACRRGLEEKHTNAQRSTEAHVEQGARQMSHAFMHALVRTPQWRCLTRPRDRQGDARLTCQNPRRICTGLDAHFRRWYRAVPVALPLSYGVAVCASPLHLRCACSEVRGQTAQRQRRRKPTHRGTADGRTHHTVPALAHMRALAHQCPRLSSEVLLCVCLTLLCCCAMTGLLVPWLCAAVLVSAHSDPITRHTDQTRRTDAHARCTGERSEGECNVRVHARVCVCVCAGWECASHCDPAAPAAAPRPPRSPSTSHPTQTHTRTLLRKIE